MTDQELRQLVIRALTEVAPEIDPEAIDPDTDLVEQLDIDSMDFLNFVIALHKEFRTEIPEKDYPKLATLDGCVAYLTPTHP